VATLAPMSVSVIWASAGWTAGPSFTRLNIRQHRRLLAFDPRELARQFGDAGRTGARSALGPDVREAHTDRASKSIGKERTSPTTSTTPSSSGRS